MIRTACPMNWSTPEQQALLTHMCVATSARQSSLSGLPLPVLAAGSVAAAGAAAGLVAPACAAFKGVQNVPQQPHAATL